MLLAGLELLLRDVDELVALAARELRQVVEVEYEQAADVAHGGDHLALEPLRRRRHEHLGALRHRQHRLAGLGPADQFARLHDETVAGARRDHPARLGRPEQHAAKRRAVGRIEVP